MLHLPAAGCGGRRQDLVLASQEPRACPGCGTLEGRRGVVPAPPCRRDRGRRGAERYRRLPPVAPRTRRTAPSPGRCCLHTRDGGPLQQLHRVHPFLPNTTSISTAGRILQGYRALRRGGSSLQPPPLRARRGRASFSIFPPARHRTHLDRWLVHHTLHHLHHLRHPRRPSLPPPPDRACPAEGARGRRSSASKAAIPEPPTIPRPPPARSATTPPRASTSRAAAAPGRATLTMRRRLRRSTGGQSASSTSSNASRHMIDCITMSSHILQHCYPNPPATDLSSSSHRPVIPDTLRWSDTCHPPPPPMETRFNLMSYMNVVPAKCDNLASSKTRTKHHPKTLENRDQDFA